MDKVCFQFDVPSDIAHEFINFCIEKDISVSDFFAGSALLYIMQYEKLQLQKVSGKKSVDSLT